MLHVIQWKGNGFLGILKFGRLFGEGCYVVYVLEYWYPIQQSLRSLILITIQEHIKDTIPVIT